MLDTVGPELQVINKSENAITLKEDEKVLPFSVMSYINKLPIAIDGGQIFTVSVALCL